MTALRDPADLHELSAEQLLADPLERAAIALYSMSYMTPEEVGVFLARCDGALVKAWTGPGVRECDRNLYRRRAQLVLDPANQGAAA